MGKTLYLIHCAAAPQLLARTQSYGGHPVQWIFLGQDYGSLSQWERALGRNFSRIPLRERLAAAADVLRRPFLDLLTELGRKHDSPAWWAARISERNTAGSPLFLYCCYLKLAQEQLASHESSLAIVGESQALLSSLAEYAREHGYAVRRLSGRRILRSRLTHGARVVVRAGKFLGRAMRQALVSFSPKPFPAKVPVVLLHTFLDEQCFGDDGEFHDRYFPGLRAWLERQGLAVTHMPILYNTTRGDTAAWRWLESSRQHFINPYKFYRISDYAAALKKARLSRTFDFRSTVLEGLNVSSLFREAQETDAYDVGTLEALLSYRLPQRLRERGIRVDLVIAEYENMILEKLLVAGFRKYSPDTKLVGFQHGALYPMLLCNFITGREAEFAPLPDRIVCNGPFYRDLLVSEGLPGERAVSGPSLRFRHLWSSAPSALAPARKGIFVPLPLVQSDAVELVAKLVEAFGSQPEISLSMKPHPMSPAGMLEAAGALNLPQNFHVVEGEISHWLARAQAVIGLSSSALFEAIAAGVPVVSVGREGALDLDPLAWHAGVARQCSSSSEILEETLRLFHLTPSELESYRLMTQQVLLESFAPVDDTTMGAFIDGLLPEASHLC